MPCPAIPHESLIERSARRKLKFLLALVLRCQTALPSPARLLLIGRGYVDLMNVTVYPPATVCNSIGHISQISFTKGQWAYPPRPFHWEPMRVRPAVVVRSTT